jgi:hypothetical protein
MAPSPPTQTGRAVFPHPAFQFVVQWDELAQALDSGPWEVSHQPRRLAPRSPAWRAVHCGFAATRPARSSGTPARSASRHYAGSLGRTLPRRPTPRPCPPWLHGRYPLLGYYEDSDPTGPYATGRGSLIHVTRTSDHSEPFLKLWEQAMFDLLRGEGKITEEVVANIRPWRHSGFSIDRACGSKPKTPRASRNWSSTFCVVRLAKLE